MQRFQPLSIGKSEPRDVVLAKMRINSLGSLFYFIKKTLKRKRLTNTLHRDWCISLERDHLKDVYELPRDHFKSTICSEGFPMWRALPFTRQDEDYFSVLGYSVEFIAYMKRVHRRDSRNLLVCENITNAAKLGSRIARHYESGALFRAIFPEILPDSSCTWAAQSLQHKRSEGADPHGEGTFDFIGVGGALQSRHYDGMIVQDDLVGRKAIESISIMDKTIEYHQILPGVFENPESATYENDEFVVGNRWSYSDLNSHIRENEPWFRVESHSALGGCCPNHAADTPVFPEEFSFEKLEKLRERFGNYSFSCHFLNNPAAPENADFKPEWLNYFSIEEPNEKNNFRRMIRHEVRDGIVKKDIPISHLRLGMSVDPNHSGNSGLGRCRHAIDVVGLSEAGDYYLLDCFAEACGYDEFYAAIFRIAGKWHLTKFGLETIAAQRYIGHHIQQMSALSGHSLRIIELKGEVEGPDGELTRKKEWRIRNVLAPIFESCRFYTQRRMPSFMEEYTTFPKGKFVDILDALAYVPQLIKTPQRYDEYMRQLTANQQGARRVNMPYCTDIH
jgi:hypothetical protein